MVMPPRPWPEPLVPQIQGLASMIGPQAQQGLTSPMGPLMPALVDRIMGARTADDIEMPHICKTCGHAWKAHVNERCVHLFGMEGDFAHVCGCSPDERQVLYPLLPGELGPEPAGITPAMTGIAGAALAVAASILVGRR